MGTSHSRLISMAIDPSTVLCPCEATTYNCEPSALSAVIWIGRSLSPEEDFISVAVLTSG